MGLAHLTPSHARAITAQAITIINDANGRVHYAVQSFSAFSATLGNQLQLYDRDGKTGVTLPVKADPKGLLGMMAFICFPICPRHPRCPSAAQCEIFVSEDKTKVTFIGEKRTRADALYAG
jgi:hypothetical protein